MWRGHADLRSQHVEVRLRSQHVEVRLRSQHVEVRLRHVEVRHVKWSCIGGAARRKYQCANYREVGSKMARHGFLLRRFTSARQPVFQE
jgi:hypothetical protein